MTADAMLQHVLQLAKAFDIDVILDPRLPHDAAGAGEHPKTKRRFIMIAGVTDETTYAVALHELGHCVSPTGIIRTQKERDKEFTLRTIKLRIEEEIAAWQWAKRNALEWTPVMIRVRTMTFGTYRREARMLGIRI